MAFCAAAKCKRADRRVVMRGETHEFSGYGFWNVYHRECCPGSEDGEACIADEEHTPEAQAAINRIYALDERD